MLGPPWIRLVFGCIGWVCLAACGRGVSADPVGERFAVSSGAGGSMMEPEVPAPDGERGAGRLPLGAPNCQSGEECQSGACALDIDGLARCCDRVCQLESGRVCSTDGACVCSRQHEEASGRCLLRQGLPCSSDAECASTNCTDGVCCDTACDRLCERCNASGRPGQCVLDAEDAECESAPGLACTDRGRCRLGLGFTCERDADCDSDQCEPSASETICCDRACNGICQSCGDDGLCGVKASDERCPLVTCEASNLCVEYVAPRDHACTDSGSCAGCSAIYARQGVPCGVGQQCNGAGECVFTGMGLVAAGAHHTCAIRDNGNVRCWGENADGQLGAAFGRARVGDDETPGSVAELELSFDRPVWQVTAGVGHTCVLFDGGGVRCWGRVPLGFNNPFSFDGPDVSSLLGTDEVQLDSSGLVDPLRTGDVRLPGNAVQISAGWLGAHTCALLDDGRVSCWGSHVEGQCGVGESAGDNVGGGSEPLPVVNLGGSRALEVRAGMSHTCVVMEGGVVSCWGGGATGYASGAHNIAEPIGPLDVGAPVISLATAPSYTCALLASLRVRCWGRNGDGQLGYGHVEDIGFEQTPAQAAAQVAPDHATGFLGGDALVGGDVQQVVSVIENAVCARYVGGSIRCWGHNDRGQLGYGHNVSFPGYTIDRLLLIPAGTRYQAGGDVDFGAGIAALAENGRCATAFDAQKGRGALYCWGPSPSGEVGIVAAFPDGSERLTPFELGAVEWEPAQAPP